MTSKDINNLVINKVENQQVYDYMVENNLINDDELYLVETSEESVEIEIDTSLSSTSENPVQNKVITSEFSKYETKLDDLTNELLNMQIKNYYIGTTLPSNEVGEDGDLYLIY